MLRRKERKGWEETYCYFYQCCWAFEVRPVGRVCIGVGCGGHDRDCDYELSYSEAQEGLGGAAEGHVYGIVRGG